MGPNAASLEGAHQINPISGLFVIQDRSFPYLPYLSAWSGEGDILSPFLASAQGVSCAAAKKSVPSISHRKVLSAAIFATHLTFALNGLGRPPSLPVHAIRNASSEAAFDGAATIAPCSWPYCPSAFDLIGIAPPRSSHWCKTIAPRARNPTALPSNPSAWHLSQSQCISCNVATDCISRSQPHFAPAYSCTHTAAVSLALLGEPSYQFISDLCASPAIALSIPQARHGDTPK